ncbi:MAG TPA: hypothetical protein VF747_17015, partial [Blastocatellia bacterium]
MNPSTVVDSVQTFIPVGSHNDGLAISSAVALTKPAGATKLRIQALTQNIRYTLNGTTPTSSKGFQLKAGDPPITLHIAGGVTVTVIE